MATTKKSGCTIENQFEKYFKFGRDSSAIQRIKRDPKHKKDLFPKDLSQALETNNEYGLIPDINFKFSQHSSCWTCKQNIW